MALGLLVDVYLGLPAVGLGWNVVAPLALAAWELGGDGALAGGAYGVGVFGEDSSLVTRGWWLDGGEAGGDFFVGDVEG